MNKLSKYRGSFYGIYRGFRVKDAKLRYQQFGFPWGSIELRV